ncbi:MAG: hypothetical protein OEW87_05830 [Flavobacteriaceae bacterium]|nr:hypothetical protein [Flavobacteriaceae bacterium]
MFLSIFLVILLLLILYLLWMPMVLFIDTDTQQYYMQFKGLAKASIEGHKEEVLRIHLKVVFFHFYFYPLKEIGNPKKKKIEKNSKKSSKRIGMRKGLSLLRSFKVKRLLLDIDTGDCVKNAQLYPYFAFLNYKLGTFHINFEGRNRMALYMQNRPINIIRSFINF